MMFAQSDFSYEMQDTILSMGTQLQRIWSSNTCTAVVDDKSVSRLLQGVDEILEDWERDAASMTTVIMDMEKAMISPVFFQRLALKRKQRELALNAAPAGGKLRNARDKVRSSAQGFLGRFKGRKSTTDNGQAQPTAQGGGRRRIAPGALRSRATQNDDEEPDDEAEDTAGRSRGPVKPSFAQKARPSASGDAVFQPTQARSLRFVIHIKTWGTCLSLMHCMQEAWTCELCLVPTGHLVTDSAHCHLLCISWGCCDASLFCRVRLTGRPARGCDRIIFYID